MMQSKPALPLWRPRDGRNEAHLKWHDALTSFEHDFGIDVDEPCPSLSDLVEEIPYYSTQGLVDDNDRQIFAEWECARAEWIALNELVFDVIRASLILEGPSLERDLRMLGTLMGSAKDGRAIRKWAKGFADMNTVASQADLMLKLEAKLPEKAILTELESHSTKLWSSWLLISGNDPNNLAKLESFHYRWLNSLPSQPIGSHLSHVRKWLADKISERSTILHDVDTAIDIMIRYAGSIGLTDPVNPRLQDASPAAGIGMDQGPSIHAMLSTMKNDCNFCKANSCQSNQYTGPASCVSRWDSKVPISHVKGGDHGKAMVLGLRGYHEQNKDANSLKHIRIDLDDCLAKVRAMKAAPKGGAGTDAGGQVDAGKNNQVTPIMNVGDIKVKALPGESEITDVTMLQNWLNGMGSAPVITMIGSDKQSLVSVVDGKTPHLAKWRQRRAMSRSSRQISYSPYAVHATGVDALSAPKDGNFTSLVRVLDHSISADKKPVRFSLRGSINSLLRYIAQLTDSTLRMEIRNIVCVLAAIHVLGRYIRPHQRRIIDKLKMLPYVLALRAIKRLQEPLAALVVYGQRLSA
jgi:hypothetical protein